MRAQRTTSGGDPGYPGGESETVRRGGTRMLDGNIPRIDGRRLVGHLEELGSVGRRPDGSCCRLALTDEDRVGRDLVVTWMRDLGLEVRVDRVGNIFGIRAGSEDLRPVMTGSHVDTVATGGKYD